MIINPLISYRRPALSTEVQLYGVVVGAVSVIRIRHCLFLIVWFLFLFSALSLSADQIATTENGKKVLLRDNGTWSDWDSTMQKKSTPLSAEKQRNYLDQTSSTGNESPPQQSVYVDFVRSTGMSDFRKASWEMTKTLVKRSEDIQLIFESADTLKYKYILNEMNCTIIYCFKNDKLIAARYVIEQDHINPSQFNQDYYLLKKYLSSQYGGAVSQQDNWKNDLYQADTSRWGFAVSIGFLTRSAAWKGKSSKIILLMNGENHQINLSINYSSLATAL
ncbi:MAG: hypothetical protein JW795_12120 [Chitinivibrionales bacterium]|nr:hypothetical protein [Chitinivibrionales bacterium]